jgi:Bacterial Ig-like domain (group 3)/FG-GAP-like repeat
MTRKFTLKTPSFRGIALFIAVLAVMIALAALAQTKGASQEFGKSQVTPVQGSAVPSNAGPMDTGTPLFLPPVAYNSGGFFARSVAARDLNGDGIPDLLVGNDCLSNAPGCLVGGVEVLLGVGDGTFRVLGGLYGTAGLLAKVSIADVNGDGKPDMLAAGCNFKDCFTGVVTVRTGNGDGTFAGGTYVFGTGGMSPSSPAVADLNGDGKRDLVVANCGNGCQTGIGTVGVLLGNGDATFQTAVTYGTGGVGAHSVRIADLNGDGKPDLVVANACASGASCPTGPGSVGVLFGNGDGTFQTAVAYGSGGYDAESIAVADVNGDGKLDVVVVNFCGDTTCSLPGTVGVLLGNGDGTFQSVVPYSSGGSFLGSIAVVDVNRDGKRDIVATASNNDVVVLLGNGNGTFQAPVGYGTGGFGARALAVADVNGDGRPDVMVTNACYNNTNPNCPHGSVGVLLNDTGPHSPTTTLLVSNVNPAAVNQQVIYTATVKNQSGGPLTGTVVFKHNTSTTTVPLVVGQAIYKVTYSGSGTHLITATYSGDADNATSTSAALTEYVGLVPTKTILSTSRSPSYIGQPVTFAATVTWTYGTVPNGEPVTFFDGTTAIGTGATLRGVARFTTSSLTVGTHTIKATYPGDAEFKPSSGTVKQVVNKYPTTTTLTSSLNPSHFGQAVTFTAHVTSTGPAPIGTVRFLDGTTGIGQATLSGGVAKLTKSNLAVGTHPVTAHYNGDAASATSTSPVLNQVVQ